MERINDIIKPFYFLLITLACVCFVLGRKQVFQDVGMLYKSMIKEEIKNDGFAYLNTFVSPYVPAVKYAASSLSTNSRISFKEQFVVTKEDGNIVKGSREDSFAIYLLDIRNSAGNSVLLRMSETEIAQIEEVPAPFVYEEKQDMLYCFESGIFTVIIKVYAANGGQEIYEFQLPVECGKGGGQ